MSSQERFGGIVPEVASRHHLELVNPVVDAALAEAGVGLARIDSLAVTRGPGLIGALLISPVPGVSRLGRRVRRSPKGEAEVRRC